MINYIKVQTEILKKFVRNDFECLAYDKFNDEIWVTYDGFVLRRIPNNLFFLDANKFRESHVVKHLLNNEPLATRAADTLERRLINDKDIAIKFMVNGEPKYMNKKFADECDNWKYYKQAFYGYCDDVLCKVVMEVNVDKNK